MSKEIELHNRWLGGDVQIGVRFMLNDYVEVISGKHSEELGSVVSIIQFAPSTSYLVETESGKDIEVTESEIIIANL